MNLSHWNTESKFSLHEAACLIAGVDPLTKHLRTAETDGRRALIERQLERDYRLEIEGLMNELDARSKLGLRSGGYDTYRRSHVFSVRSVDCETTLRMSADEEPPYVWATSEYLYSECFPIVSQEFSRDELSRWCRLRGWNAAFDFKAAPAWKRGLERSSRVELAHPRTE